MKDILNAGVDIMGEKWLAVIGSPRREKNTDLMVNYMIEGLYEKNIRVDKFFLGSTNISTHGLKWYNSVIIELCWNLNIFRLYYNRMLRPE